MVMWVFRTLSRKCISTQLVMGHENSQCINMEEIQIWNTLKSSYLHSPFFSLFHFHQCLYSSWNCWKMECLWFWQMTNLASFSLLDFIIKLHRTFPVSCEQALSRSVETVCLSSSPYRFLVVSLHSSRVQKWKYGVK